MPTAKSRRCYHRVMSGLERGGQIRFLTLTSSDDSPSTCQNSFRALYMRLKRRNLLQGYIKVPENTKSGRQHLHILFRGSYIEQALISKWWDDIHHAQVVDIRAVKKGENRRKIASDMASYMAKSSLYRYSWNWGWVWRGFCRDWAELKRRVRALEKAGSPTPFKEILRFWQRCLWTGSPAAIYDLPPP